MGANLEVTLGETIIATVPLVSGHARLALTSQQGHRVPAVEEGVVVSLRYEGAVLLQGTFERD